MYARLFTAFRFMERFDYDTIRYDRGVNRGLKITECGQLNLAHVKKN